MMEHLPIQRHLQAVRQQLISLRGPAGFWEGELSTSALSTATAVCALACAAGRSGVTESWSNGTNNKPTLHHSSTPLLHHSNFLPLIRNGLHYLAEHQNADGGWGDTERSRSNISTTMLARAAFHIAEAAGEYGGCLDGADDYIQRAGGIAAVRARYGKDKTFAVPILMTCALAGLADWSEVDALPFELACVPPRFFAALRLPVVSYALPALIAIGQARFSKRPPRNPLTRALRTASLEKSLRVLEKIQPTSGGFLEATPLTSFVTMALTAAGQTNHPVTQRCIDFLVNSVRPDGSWPIDSNLSCWLTTLAVNALDVEPTSEHSALPIPHSAFTRDWLLSCQFREPHPYTNAAPGGWGWTHLPGSVPDADDTAGALLALAKLPPNDASHETKQRGAQWLLDLQNSDGGWPTFCRGWTNLPFDRSGADLTAHVIRALDACRARWIATSGRDAAGRDSVATQERSRPKVVIHRLEHAISRGFSYLARQQRVDGSWLPLWFGNEHVAGEENPVYGTSRVLAAYHEVGLAEDASAKRGRSWLVSVQNENGGWGGAKGAPSSVEETSLAVTALLSSRRRTAANAPSTAETRLLTSAATNGLRWLIKRLEAGTLAEPAPIGFYFAKLWYFEKLYPLIFAAEALGYAAALNKTNVLEPVNG